MNLTLKWYMCLLEILHSLTFKEHHFYAYMCEQAKRY